MLILKRGTCARLAALALFVLVHSGCGSGAGGYTPTTGEAHGALDSALSAWRDGKPYGPLDGTTRVQIADSAWQSGEVLESFEIGEEKDEGDSTKQFEVRLKLKKPAGEKSVHYFVHGRDPVWVYREEDYKRMVNMDNNPELPSTSKPGSRRSGRPR
jgi:hypothetical protein